MSTVLISGCSSGFGFETALRFAREGYTVWAGLLSLDDDGGLMKAAEGLGGTIRPVALDIRSREAVEAAVAPILEEGPIDILVNNAGITVHGAMEDTPDEDIAKVFNVNVYGHIRLARAVMPAMRAAGQGCIINVTSGAGFMVQPFYGVYSATKYAMEAVSEALALELEPFGVRVRIIQPGKFATLIETGQPEATHEDSPYFPRLKAWVEAADNAMGRDGESWSGGHPSEVADVVYAVATNPDSAFRTMVGPDVQMIADRRLGRSFEEYREVLVELLGW